MRSLLPRDQFFFLLGGILRALFVLSPSLQQEFDVRWGDVGGRGVAVGWHSVGVQIRRGLWHVGSKGSQNDKGHTHAHTHTCMHAHTRARAHIHARLHAHIRAHTRMCTQDAHTKNGYIYKLHTTNNYAHVTCLYILCIQITHDTQLRTYDMFIHNIYYIPCSCTYIHIYVWHIAYYRTVE